MLSELHMTELVDQILMYSQQEEGKRPGNSEVYPRFDLRECGEQILAIFPCKWLQKVRNFL